MELKRSQVGSVGTKNIRPYSLVKIEKYYRNAIPEDYTMKKFQHTQSFFIWLHKT